MLKIIRNVPESTRTESRYSHAISTKAIENLPKLDEINQASAEARYLGEVNVETNSNIAVKQKINIVLDRDGNIVSPTDKIILGSRYDRNVTILHFDLSQLLWHDSSTKNYIFRVAFFDEEKYKHPLTVEGLAVDDPDYQGMTYEFDGTDFWVPWELTKEPKTYRIALVIKEIEVTDKEEGNVTASESFVSAMFEGEVLDNFFRPTQLNIDTVEDEKTSALTKSSIVTILADDGTLAVSDNRLGNEHDSYIKRFSFGKTFTAHLSEFNSYLLFRSQSNTTDAGSVIAAKIDMENGTWIPSEVTKNAGCYDVMVVAYSGDYNDPDYLFTSTIIKMVVTNNFLQDNAFVGSSGSGSGGNILSNNYNNFITADGEGIVTRDNERFFWNER